MMIILLDLNYTLVANSEQKISPFTNQILNETYRHDLIEKIQGNIIILITARPKIHQEQTLNSIYGKTGWLPTNFYFNYTKLPPPQFKQLILKKYILEKYPLKDLLAVESNPRTRNMYRTHSIPAWSYQEFINLKEYTWNKYRTK
jgi:hypothetical protein